MPDHIILLIGILSVLSVFGSLMMWRLWSAVKRLYNSHNHEVPHRVALLNLGLAGCTVGPPLAIIVYLLIFS